MHFNILRPNPRLDSIDDFNAEDWGLMGHWSVAGHTKVAQAVSNAIQEVMASTGKPWDQRREPSPSPCMVPTSSNVIAPGLTWHCIVS